MSGYLLKPQDQEALASIDWSQGYLEPGEYVDADLGWSVVASEGESGGESVAQIRVQTFDDKASYARIAKGVPGQVYMLCARALTNTGRALERAIVLRIAA